MQRRRLTPVDFAVWGASALLLALGLALPPVWGAADPQLQAELALLDEAGADPWETDFVYEDAVVRSAGPDRRFETPDDLELQPELTRAKLSRLLPVASVLGVLLLAGWELGLLVVGLLRGPWRGWVDEGLILGGWLLVGGLVAWGTAELLIRRELLRLPEADWLVVPWSTAITGTGALAGGVSGLLVRLRLVQAAKDAPPTPAEPELASTPDPELARPPRDAPEEIQDGA